MKQKIFLALIMLICAVGAQADTTWDFTTVSEADANAIAKDALNWTKDKSKNRYATNIDLNNQSFTAGGSELALTKGLKFTGKAGKFRINIDEQRLEMNGKDISIAIPVAKGNTITVVAKSGNADDAPNRYLTISGATVVSEFAKTATGMADWTKNVATATADGYVTITSNGGGINLQSITVSGSSSTGGNTPSTGATVTAAKEGTIKADLTTNSGSQNPTVNQLSVTASGNTHYYNTADLNKVSIDEKSGAVTVSMKSGDDKYYGSATKVAFKKKSATASGITITDAKGWNESAYIKWTPVSGITSYNVYVKGGQYSDYTKIDQQLVRNYGTYGRADVVGLKAGTYSLKVVAVGADKTTEIPNTYGEATNLEVRNYNRQGFAHFNRTEGVGAYNNDGTLKAGAIVIYVTKNTAKTVSAKLANGTFTGIQTIIDAYQKKNVNQPPLAVRIIGEITANDVDGFSSSSEGIQIKGAAKDTPMNITIEGIGDDATIHGFGFLVRNSASVEFRNIGIMRQMDDGISLDTDNKNIWIHNVDVYYGKQGGGDHAKGDGGIDVKQDSKFVTIDHCHFWDTGKSSMCGMKSESGPNYITYHHNWFDHSDSRHPRIRTMSVHVYNNYFDGVAKYGVGAASASDVFVEKNYFRGTKYPMTIASQAHDIKDDGSSVLSGEDGGIIKAYDNEIAELPSKGGFTPYSENNTQFDAYVVSSRDEKVPSTVTAKKGGHTYSNFDTDASLMYKYTPDNANDVPANVTGFYGAGRINHGDAQYKFNNATDDTNDTPMSELVSLIDNYKSTLVGIYGDENAASSETGSEETGGSTGGSTGSETGGSTGGSDTGSETGGSTVDQPTETIVVSFEGNKPSNDIVTVTGSYSTSKGTATYNNVTYSTCVKMESKTNIVVNATKSYKMTLVFADSETASAKIDGTKITGTGSTYTTTITGKTTITKANSVNLFAIILAPTE